MVPSNFPLTTSFDTYSHDWGNVFEVLFDASEDRSARRPFSVLEQTNSTSGRSCNMKSTIRETVIPGSRGSIQF